MQVNAKELRHHLSEYLERASRGQSLEITMRGKPIARLQAIGKPDDAGDDALFGIWADRNEMEIDAHIREIRDGRHF